MKQISYQVSALSKSFNRRKIFSDISFSLKEFDSLAITGRNGSGKSTLLKILTEVLSPTKGEIEMKVNAAVIQAGNYFEYIGLVSPYLQLYDEFTGWENLDLFRKVRCVDASDDYISELLRRVNLWERRNDFVRTYSSGMKQRLKYAFALIHSPFILLLDEPTSNLDTEGIATVYQIMEDQKKNGILIVATNDTEDMKMCEQALDLNAQYAGSTK